MGANSAQPRAPLDRRAPAEPVARDELFFPRGIPAFEEHTRFLLVFDERYRPLCRLQSLVDAAVGFLVVDPQSLVDDYTPDLGDQDLDGLDLEAGESPELLCLLVVHESGEVTANLKAPVVLNRRRRRGKQIILTDERYPLRAPVDFSAGRTATGSVQPC